MTRETVLPDRYDPIEHVQLLLDSFARLLGRELISRRGSPEEQAQRLFDAPFVVVSHGTEADPVLNYGTAAALVLWEMDWLTFVRTPSRLTAEPMHRDERARLLERTSRDGFVDDYSGIRISSSGRRFRIERAIVWNLVDGDGNRRGQAATFDHWTPLEATERPVAAIHGVDFPSLWRSNPSMAAVRSTGSEAFPGIPKIRYEGPSTKNMLAFRHYDPDALVEGKTMRDHLRFAVSYWHTFRGTGSDPFGAPTMIRPWEKAGDSLEAALARVEVAFEFMQKLGVGFYCFHDRDVAPEGRTLAESHKHLDAVAATLEKHQRETGIRLLWGTANLFSNPRYVHGAATSCNAEVFAYAAAQVKKAMEVTHMLGGAGYVFWGGREGYQCLWNTDMKREVDHLARFMHMAVDHAKQIGFTGQFYFEPKPREPTKHQYDFDCATCINFLRTYGLEKHVKMNIETNHATLAGHEMQHELEYAGMQGFLGSIDANTGDTLVGWDTDQFPTNIYLTTQIMYSILKYGGLAPGGVNFDAKVRRESFEPVDLFHAHIGGMDAFARGLKIAAAMRADGAIQKLVDERYASWSGPLGKRIEAGGESFASLEQEMLSKGEAAACSSGRQELFENVINTYL